MLDHQLPAFDAPLVQEIDPVVVDLFGGLLVLRLHALGNRGRNSLVLPLGHRADLKRSPYPGASQRLSTQNLGVWESGRNRDGHGGGDPPDADEGCDFVSRPKFTPAVVPAQIDPPP